MSSLSNEPLVDVALVHLGKAVPADRLAKYYADAVDGLAARLIALDVEVMIAKSEGRPDHVLRGLLREVTAISQGVEAFKARSEAAIQQPVKPQSPIEARIPTKPTPPEPSR
jgi:hypothetical protein